MAGYVFVKSGVRFRRIAPAGFRILRAIDYAADRLETDLTITCGTEAHALTDPHTLGEAFDVRTHGLSPEQVAEVVVVLQSILPVEQFLVLHESIGEPNEHIHIQRRKGTVFPPPKISA